ncbi:hypothetical protein HMPREF0322_01719 [Desulfitobacterium hafniense DP7]|uniref:Uncharacterized protein n=1 Tax=Desulfitobacterium hafniense DP7 TaxID=537010 RepID=G9XL85_DESHA|nr:hypothetical protein [Desulfitobacterium hafniense]EHL07602.1 hypothetical protein HMPREF0322_01719 [Desulfitobacterium hafniense DP7]
MAELLLGVAAMLLFLHFSILTPNSESLTNLQLIGQKEAAQGSNALGLHFCTGLIAYTFVSYSGFKRRW